MRRITMNEANQRSGRMKCDTKKIVAITPITFRVPSDLKSEASRAAAARGLSLNSLVSLAIKNEIAAACVECGQPPRPKPQDSTPGMWMDRAVKAEAIVEKLKAAHAEALDALLSLRDNSEDHNLRGLSPQKALRESVDMASVVLAKAGRR